MGEVLQYILLANVTLIAAFACAWLFEKTAIVFKLRRAYRLRLYLAIAALCAASLPALLAPIIPLFASTSSINGTDFLVAQFLKGNINLSATQMSQVLTAKNTALDVMFGGASFVSKLLLVMFGAAALLRAIYVGFSVLKIRQHINDSTLLHAGRRAEVRHTIQTTVPYSTRGFWKYYVLIPTNLVADPQSLRIALGHEAQHIRQGDVNWEILLSFLSPLFALNPAYWLLSDRIRRFREYTCDAALLKKGGIAARDYCYLLLEIASQAARERAAKSSIAHTMSVPLLGREGIFYRSTKNALRTRIIVLSQGAAFVDHGISRYFNFAPAILLFLIVGAGVLMSAKPGSWSHERLMLSTVVNLERLNRINGFGTAPF